MTALAAALMLYVCIGPTGWVETMSFADPSQAEAALHRALGQSWQPTGVCRWADAADLPPKMRPDPHRAGAFLTQRHRWRGLPSGQIIVDPSVKRPHGDAIRREYRVIVSPGRWSQVVATNAGAAFDRAMLDGRWADVAALLNSPGPDQPFLPTEIAQLRTILRDYEAD